MSNNQILSAGILQQTTAVKIRHLPLTQKNHNTVQSEGTHGASLDTLF